LYANPLKHGLVRRVGDWPYSSFHRDVRAGLFEAKPHKIRAQKASTANDQYFHFKVINQN
jgi:hypothetical protein